MTVLDVLRLGVEQTLMRHRPEVKMTRVRDPKRRLTGIRLVVRMTPDFSIR
jgi:hypothetical protein